MTHHVDRRAFLQQAAAAGLGVAASTRGEAFQAAPSDRVRVAVMGTNSRGSALAMGFAGLPSAEVAYICDVDERAIAKGIQAVEKGRQRRGTNGSPHAVPAGVKDFRRALDDTSVDALVIAAPDHWHAPAALLAARAGKHVYVEKPCGHNPREGEMLVEAARKHSRVIQMGTQRRSMPQVIEVVNQIRDGSLIGRAYYARAWYTNTRAPIGRGKSAEVPAWLDYELWQGPAPRRAYKDNVIHYNWHWFWHWGTGEACNNGTHTVDVMRWALGADYPTRVTSAGGRFHYEDDWETPDTQTLSFEFPGRRMIAWEGRSCNGGEEHGLSSGVVVYGERGSVLIGDNAWTVYDNDSKAVKKVVAPDRSTTDLTGPGLTRDQHHLSNFVDAVRGRAKLNAEIEEGHKSVLLCHLGNIAQRVGRSLRCDPANGHIIADKEATKLWARDYEKGWEPKV